MKRVVALGAVLAGLAAWIAISWPTVERGTAAAPAVQIERAQDAEFVPSSTSGKPIFILAIGSDARPGVCMPVPRCLADSIHIIGVNPKKGAATILGFPRDSYVPIPGVGTRKINEALHSGGPELVVGTVEGVTGIRMDYWMLTSFRDLKGMVDSVGGVRVDVPYPMNDPFSGSNFSPGPARLDGAGALAFSRDRHSTPDGDFSRSENQGLLMGSALQQFSASFAKDPVTLFTWIAAGVRHVETNLSFEEVFDLALTALRVNPRRITNLVVPGSISMAGAASVVQLSSGASAIYGDLADDGIVAGGPGG